MYNRTIMHITRCDITFEKSRFLITLKIILEERVIVRTTVGDFRSENADIIELLFKFGSTIGN